MGRASKAKLCHAALHGTQKSSRQQNEIVKQRKPPKTVSTQKAPVKPLILLDVDGVINRVLHCKKIWMDEVELEIRCGKFIRPILYSPSVVSALNEIAKSDLAEIRWLTYWNQEAQEYLAPCLGLRHFEMGNDLRYTDKGPAAKEWAILHPERPIVWIDDEISMHSFCDSEFWETRPKTLLIAPKDHLSSEHLETLMNFLRTHQQT